MQKTSPTVHHHFANFFKNEELEPFAYAVSRKLAQGSVCVDLKDKDGATAIFEGYNEKDLEMDMSTATDILMQTDLVANGGEVDVKDKPFVLNGDNFYITRYYNYETQIIEGINSLIAKGADYKESRVNWLSQDDQFQKLVEARDQKEVDWQLVASALAFINNFTIITGGPGTGKTTTVAKILSLLYKENSELNVKLAAPTGKAAMRMKETLSGNEHIPEDFRKIIGDLKPFTLHRLLGTNHQSPYFKHNKENLLIADVIIVDEASMIDVALFAKLLSSVAPATRLILLGDQNQLASVEAGSLLGDICNSVAKKNVFSADLCSNLRDLLPQIHFAETDHKALLQDNLVELQHFYRFDKEFKELSKAVITNSTEMIAQFFNKENPTGNITIDPDYQEKNFNDFIKGYLNYIAEENISKALGLLNSQRILAVIRRGNQGVEGLNIHVEKYLAKMRKIKLDQTFYENRPVMVTRNHPDLNLFNGDVGIVRTDKESGKRRIYFLDEEKEIEAGKETKDGGKTTEHKTRNYSPGLLTDVETVFAMTVHKSQGSEFNNVLLVMPKSEELPLLTRELLYTGITRAKERLLIQGTKEVIKKSAEARVNRASGITNRI